MTKTEHEDLSNLDTCRQVYGLLEKHWVGVKPIAIKEALEKIELVMGAMKKNVDDARKKARFGS